jgi:hypothetical protein
MIERYANEVSMFTGIRTYSLEPINICIRKLVNRNVILHAHPVIVEAARF